MSSIPRLRSYSGPALLSYGFRPFFLFGALYAGLSILVWLPMFYGDLQVTSAFGPVDWHVHEMLYGYLPAIVAGFLLTAIPNWTGRLPIQGMPLLGLFLLWLAGRIAVTVSAQIGWLAAAVIDNVFLIVLIAACAREIVAGKNWRNLRVLSMVVLLLAGNIAFHVEAHVRGHAEYGTRIGIAAIMLLIILIGGRIIPSFTRNWLVRENPGRLPAPFSRLDAITLAVSTLALLLWIALPTGSVAAATLALAAALNLVRLGRWAGDRTLRDRLVLILHVGYLLVPVGFALAALAALDTVAETAAVHAWMVGGAGIMTLAVMSRASLGHTGNALVASPAIQAVYLAVIVAALARIAASLMPQSSDWMLHVAAFAWAVAFLGFVVAYGPLLLKPRRN